MKKRILCVLLCLILLFSFFTFESLANPSSPTRVINVVYDDSGSMYNTNGLVDTWCQAKYSMEVFAAMLGETDYMNIYYMSDYQSNTSAGPRITLSGSDGSETNVSKIHGQKTRAGNTPFNSVRKAYGDLTGASADEKWLVILTDGVFEDGRMQSRDVDAFLSQKSDDIRVMFLGMGPNATGITEVPEKEIYCVKANTSSQILSEITQICTRIFNTNKLKLDGSMSFSFDIPMSELTVFAQGKDVSINVIKNSKDKSYKPTSSPVSVKYSDCDATNYSNPPTTDLVGSLAIFKDDFKEGKYTVDVTGAETVEIYYKPNVEIAAYLKDSSGKEVTDLSNLESGEYTIEFGFVKPGKKEKLGQSELLGNVKYEAIVTSNGKKHDKQYNSGDKIQLEEGPLTIDVTAKYLDYHSVSTHLDYTIFKNKAIAFSVVDSPSYTITTKGIDNQTPIKVKATIDGKEFTEEQWNAMGIPKVKLTKSQKFKLGDFKVEKSDQVGIFNVYPTLKDNKPSTGTYSDCDLTVSYDGNNGIESWKGSSSDIPIKMQDERNWFQRNKDTLIKLGILLLILLILFGYVPGVKKYLPKKLKKKPLIDASPNVPGNESETYQGLYEKNLASTIIPYVKQRGTIKFVPSGVFGVPKLKVRGSKNRKMTLLNTRAYAGKDNITFTGNPVSEGQTKNLELTAGVNIRVEEPEWTYSCQPNM